MAVYERFQYKALTENIFGVLGRWSLMGGGRMWRLDCTLRNMSWPNEEIRIIAIKFYMGITALKGVTHEVKGKPAVFVVAHNGKTPKWMEANQLATGRVSSRTCNWDYRE